MLNILPMESGKNPLIFPMIPLMVDLAVVIGDVMVLLIPFHAELAVDLILPQSEDSPDLNDWIGDVAAFLIPFHTELAVDLIPFQTELAVLLIPLQSVERPD